MRRPPHSAQDPKGLRKPLGSRAAATTLNFALSHDASIMFQQERNDASAAAEVFFVQKK